MGLFLIIVMLGYFAIKARFSGKRIPPPSPPPPRKEILKEKKPNPPANSLYESENFHAGQINSGDIGTIFYPVGEEQQNPIIQNVQGQIFASADKKSKELLVNLSTSKEARCKITYKKIGASSEQEYSENDFSINHSIAISPLDNSSTYSYTITARDKWGNETMSDNYAVYTGASGESTADVLMGAVDDVFGWAIKK